MTIPEAIEAMRRNVGQPGEAGAMLVLADVWEEHEANVKCTYHRDGDIDMPCTNGQLHDVHQGIDGVWRSGWSDCPKCQGVGYISNGNSARAEALRLLAECGKVGHAEAGYYARGADPIGSVSHGLYVTAAQSVSLADACERIPERLALMDAYAAADQLTRERWARETRALVPGVTCERCEGRGHLDLYSCPSCYLSGTRGRVPASTEATR